jgi:hypothetical protein
VATASEAVAWFRKRRSVTFESRSVRTNEPTGKITLDSDRVVPGLCLRVHTPGEAHRDTVINTVLAHDVRMPLNNR